MGSNKRNPYWANWHGCCDCIYGIERGRFDLSRYGNLGFQFKCERVETTASIYHKPNDKCEFYKRKKG